MWRKTIRGRYRTPCEKFCTMNKKEKISSLIFKKDLTREGNFFNIFVLHSFCSLMTMVSCWDWPFFLMKCWSEKVKKKHHPIHISFKFSDSNCSNPIWENIMLSKDVNFSSYILYFLMYTVINLAHMKILTWKRLLHFQKINQSCSYEKNGTIKRSIFS